MHYAVIVYVGSRAEVERSVGPFATEKDAENWQAEEGLDSKSAAASETDRRWGVVVPLHTPR
jgi:hypothetical protein